MRVSRLTVLSLATALVSGLAAAQAPAAVTYTQDFSSMANNTAQGTGDLSDWTTGGGYWKISQVSGVNYLVLTTVPYPGLFATTNATGASSWQDYTVQGNASTSAWYGSTGKRIGLTALYQDSNNYLAMYVTRPNGAPTQLVLVSDVGGTTSVLATGTTTTDYGGLTSGRTTHNFSLSVTHGLNNEIQLVGNMWDNGDDYTDTPAGTVTGAFTDTNHVFDSGAAGLYLSASAVNNGVSDDRWTSFSVSTVPEPASLALLALGGAGLLLSRKRRRHV